MRKKTGWLLVIVMVLCCAGFAGYIFMDKQTSDTDAPEITFLTDALEISVTAGRDALLEGVTALDKRDGDVTASIVVEGVSNISADKMAEVTYAAFDKAGNVAKAQRAVRYSDYESPRFTLEQPLLFNAGRTVNVLGYINAADALDGDLSDKIKATLVGGEGSLSDAGVHDVEFRVTNSMGETVYLTIPVEIYPSGAYNATLELSENLVYLKKGDPFDSNTYLKTLKANGHEIALNTAGASASVEIKSDVNIWIAGTYCVEYTVKSGAYTGHTRLMVVVEE